MAIHSPFTHQNIVTKGVTSDLPGDIYIMLQLTTHIASFFFKSWCDQIILLMVSSKMSLSLPFFCYRPVIGALEGKKNIRLEDENIYPAKAASPVRFFSWARSVLYWRGVVAVIFPNCACWSARTKQDSVFSNFRGQNQIKGERSCIFLNSFGMGRMQQRKRKAESSNMF